MATVKKVKRKYQWKETKLVNDYLFEFYREFPPWKKQRLGVAHDAENARMYMVGQRYADAIVFTGAELVLIEAKMGGDLGGISQLETYRDLIPRTPEFNMYKNYPIRCVYLTSRRYKDIESICKQKGFDYVVYQPPWVAEYWRDLGFSI